MASSAAVATASEEAPPTERPSVEPRLAPSSLDPMHEMRIPLLDEHHQNREEGITGISILPAAMDAGRFCHVPPGQESASNFVLASGFGSRGLGASRAGRLRGRWQRCRRRLLELLNIRSSAECAKVALFVFQAFLANAFFVIGRNVGTVLFLHRGFGANQLPTAMFASGVVTVLAGQWLSSISSAHSCTVMYKWMLVLGALSLGSLYSSVVAIKGFPPVAPEDGEDEALIVKWIFTAIYIVEDMLCMFTAMQCATVAQASFTVTDAKRLFGLVQLGNSIAAVSVGTFIGWLAEKFGSEQLIVVQVGLLVLGLLPNATTARLYVDPMGAGKKKNRKAVGDSNEHEAGPWWTNFLVLAMGFWSFSVMFAKTMYEYEYNILVAQSYSIGGMVRLTGYLYAGAGVASSFVNVVGTSICLDAVGVKGGILVTPGCLLAASVAILAQPTVGSTFVGRLVDLSLRWSINNTVKSVLWIAVPMNQAVQAKPWVEGTVKKLGTSFNAMVISIVLSIVACFSSPDDMTDNSMFALSLCTLGCTGLMFLICFKVYAYYIRSMWQRIKRRELRLAEVPYAAARREAMNEGETSVGEGANGEMKLHMQPLLHKLLHGGPAQQIYILRELGESLSDSDWQLFFSHFHELPTAVQVKAVELGRKQPHRIPDAFLVELIRPSSTKAAVVTAALLAVGERDLPEALEVLEQRLASPTASVRAAAATAILTMGWGVGMGAISSAALLVLEQMLGFPLGPEAHRAQSKRTPLAAVARVQDGGRRSGAEGREDDAAAAAESSEMLANLAQRCQVLEQQWEALVKAGDTLQAVAVAIELTHVKVALHSALMQLAGKAPSSGAGYLRERRDSAGSIIPPSALRSRAGSETFGAQSPIGTLPNSPLLRASNGGAPFSPSSASGVSFSLKLQELRLPASMSKSPSPKATHARRRGSPAQQAASDRWAEMASALDLLRQLPAPRELLPVEVFVRLLRHPSHKVRTAALGFVQESDRHLPEFKEEVEAVVECLSTPHNYAAAEKALMRLKAPLAAQEEVLGQLRRAVEDHKRFMSLRSLFKDRELGSAAGDVEETAAALPFGSSAGGSTAKEAAEFASFNAFELEAEAKHMNSKPADGAAYEQTLPSVRVLSLVKYLQRQCLLYSDAHVQELASTGLCNELLNLWAELSDADGSQQLLSALVDLQAQGFAMRRELAETKARALAAQIYKGFSVQLWLRQWQSSGSGGASGGGLQGSSARAAAARLRGYLGIPASGGGGGAQLVAGAVAEEDTMRLIFRIANRYIDEHLYLQKLQLLQLAVLSTADVGGSSAAASTSSFSNEAEEKFTKSTRVFAAWRVLRSDDASAQSAVIEVLDSILPPTLKALVLPALDSTTLEVKLQSGATATAVPEELRAVFSASGRSAQGEEPMSGESGAISSTTVEVPLDWVKAWFEQPAERLGEELGLICLDLARGCSFSAPLGLRQQPHFGERQAFAPAMPNSPPADALLPKLVLLSPLQLYKDLLATHVAEIASIAKLRHLRHGAQLCNSGESYVVVSGSLKARPSEQVFGRGDVIQKLHALCRELAPGKVICTSASGATVLVIREEEMFEIMYRLPPKFALSLLKSLIRMLPAPTQTGGSRTSRVTPVVVEANTSTAMMTPEQEEGGGRGGDALAAPAAGGEANEDDVFVENRSHERHIAKAESTGDLALLAGQHHSSLAESDGEFDAPLGEGELKEIEEEDEENASSEDDKGEEGMVSIIPRQEAAAKRGRRHHATFSVLEKLVLLQGVKIFRHVTNEYLPSLAACCTPCYYEAQSEVFAEGQPTNATLYIVAEGSVGLYNAARSGVLEGQRRRSKRAGPRRLLERHLLVGDSMGNTGLLHDHEWRYTAVALEDTWLLCINRSDLTDLLRGRRELASAVIRGLFKSFTRRMQVANTEIGTDLLICADYSRQADGHDSPLLYAATPGYGPHVFSPLSANKAGSARPPSPLALPPARDQ
eukprot:TRINITY_DN38437_c0_g5_i2.p1 TRINITY_DN38437_c0_g5~~TRINITY_DN38437_c0_g5_i2.p1  ORF type:complete len:1973 (-),score=521.92 TRINITY_DN38437_c0_g5_i2:49-5967(-)